jgi:hypothetical protein
MEEIVIVPYNVHRNGKSEFRMVGVKKEEMDFFRINVVDLNISYEDFWADIRSLSSEYLLKCLTGYNEVSISLEEEVIVDKVVYLFYRVDMNHLNSYLWSQPMVFLTMYEVMNTGSVCGVAINPAVRILATKYSNYFFPEGEVPVVYYSPSKKVDFESLFGPQRQDKGDGFGLTFHFREWDETCKIRFVIFLGNVCYEGGTQQGVPWEEKWDSCIKEKGVVVSSYTSFYPLTYEI